MWHRGRVCEDVPHTHIFFHFLPRRWVGELAEIISQSPVDTIKALMRHGLMVPVNEVVDFETAAVAAPCAALTFES